MATLELLLLGALDARILFCDQMSATDNMILSQEIESFTMIEDLFKHHPSCINHLLQ